MQLSRLAALTERVRIGTSILLLPLYPPALVAKQVADLDRSSGGRVTLGIGVGGEYPQEFRAMEVPVEERGSRANEAIPLIRELWSAEPVTHHGRHYDLEDVKIHPAPIQEPGPPIVVAGRQPVAMRRAALLGDGWMPYLYSARRYASSVEKIRTYAQEAGRDLSEFEWFAFIFVNVGTDSDEARSEAAGFLGGNYAQDFDDMVSSVAAAGDTEEVTGVLQAFVDAGARHFIFTPATRGPSDAIVDRLLGEVVPALKVGSAR